MSDLTVGTAKAAPGSKVRGVIPITQLGGGRALEYEAEKYGLTVELGGRPATSPGEL